MLRLFFPAKQAKSGDSASEDTVRGDRDSAAATTVVAPTGQQTQIPAEVLDLFEESLKHLRIVSAA